MAAINLSEKEQWFLVELLVREILGMQDESWQIEDCTDREFLEEREHLIGGLLRKLKERKENWWQALSAVLRLLRRKTATHCTHICPIPRGYPPQNGDIWWHEDCLIIS
jgi:hypothetical protein